VEILSDLVGRYVDLKRALSQISGASEDLLHVHAGLLIFALAALILKRRLRSPLPLALVALFAGANELIDWYSGAPSYPYEPLFDFLNTIIWPTIIFLVARRWK